MKTEPPDDAVDHAAAGQWLEGLAGRAGAGAAHAEGARLRVALAPDVQDLPAADWRDIEARARVEADPAAAAAPAVGPDAPTLAARPREAANDPPRRRWPAWAAALALGVGLVTLMLPREADRGPGPRGVAGQSAHAAQWLVERPLEAAERLAAELRGLHAEVSITNEGERVLLRIHAEPAAVDAVNARLAPLETGLDADGRLALEVRPPG